MRAAPVGTTSALEDDALPPDMAVCCDLHRRIAVLPGDYAMLASRSNRSRSPSVGVLTTAGGWQASTSDIVTPCTLPSTGSTCTIWWAARCRG